MAIYKLKHKKCHINSITYVLSATMSWVTSDNFEADKLTVFSLPISKGYERSKLLYSYKEDAPNRDFVITVPRDPEAYITCRGVKKDTYGIGETKVETNRYGAQFILKADNKYHVEFYNTLELIGKKIFEVTGSTAIFPIKDMDGYSIIYTNLIHANDGKMFSYAYTEEEKIDILDVKDCIVRPAFLLSLLKKSPTEVKVRIQISQMYVYKEIKTFPLATMD